MQVYLVGGAVRDQLLGLTPSERDWVVVGATPAQMSAQGYRQVGKDFPVFLHPQTHEEYALARHERKQGRGYTGFEIDAGPEVSLEDDLRRRDLTINAMAEDPDGNIIDPYGGRKDLKEKRLRHVSDAFIEDPLRVLRVARFAARFAHMGFTVAPETAALMRDIVNTGELPTIAPERIWLETTKALKEHKPSVYFQTLRECGALAVIFPEIDALFGVPQRKDYHPEVDTGVHTMMVLDAAALLDENLQTRFAALTHDLGKAETPEDILPSHHGHEKRSLRLVKQLCERLRTPNTFRDIALLVAEYHTHAHRSLELKPGTLLSMFERMDIFRKPERIEQFILACEADSRGRTGFENRDYPQARYLRETAAACRATNAKGLQEQGLQGKEIAIALQRERKQQIAAIKRRYADVAEKFEKD